MHREQHGGKGGRWWHVYLFHVTSIITCDVDNRMFRSASLQPPLSIIPAQKYPWSLARASQERLVCSGFVTQNTDRVFCIFNMIYSTCMADAMSCHVHGVCTSAWYLYPITHLISDEQSNLSGIRKEFLQFWHLSLLRATQGCVSTSEGSLYFSPETQR